MITEEETTALVLAIVADAKRLGLVWTIRPATVTSVDLTGVAATGVYDGDTEPIPMINAAGAGIAERVYVVGVPEGGNFIVGYASHHDAIINPYGLHGLSITDSVAVAAFTNLAAPSSFEYRKRRSDSRTRCHMTVGFFVNNANTGMDAGVTFDGGATTLTVTRHGATSAVGVHLQSTGIQYHPLPSSTDAPLPAGLYTVQAQWRRETGTGTVSRDSQDWLSVECIEVAP